MDSEYENLLADCKFEIDAIKKFNDSNPVDDKIKFLNAYAVIKTSGTIEVIYKTMICKYLSENAKDDTKNYLEKAILDSSSNPNTGNMLKILQQVNGKTAESFNSKVNGSGAKDQLNSLVQLRNNVAHGKSITVGINTILSYFDAGKKVLTILNNLIC